VRAISGSTNFVECWKKWERHCVRSDSRRLIRFRSTAGTVPGRVIAFVGRNKQRALRPTGCRLPGQHSCDGLTVRDAGINQCVCRLARRETRDLCPYFVMIISTVFRVDDGRPGGKEHVGLRMIRLQRCQRTGIRAVHISSLSPYIFPICASKSLKSVLALTGFKSNRCFAIEHLSPTGS